MFQSWLKYSIFSRGLFFIGAPCTLTTIPQPIWLKRERERERERKDCNSEYAYWLARMHVLMIINHYISQYTFLDIYTLLYPYLYPTILLLMICCGNGNGNLGNSIVIYILLATCLYIHRHWKHFRQSFYSSLGLYYMCTHMYCKIMSSVDAEIANHASCWALYKW